LAIVLFNVKVGKMIPRVMILHIMTTSRAVSVYGKVL